MSEFLELVQRGDIQPVKDLYDHNPEVAYDQDQNGRNAVTLAVLAGKWKMVIVLLKYCRVSPHLCDKDQNSIYHLIPLGLKVSRPTLEDYAEIRAENMIVWTNEEQKERARIAEIYSKNTDLKPPENILIKKATDLERIMFDPLELFLPKYLMNKFHVVLCRQNRNNKYPSDVANEVGEIELGKFYALESEPQKIKQRLVAGLNENLVRDIASFL